MAAATTAAGRPLGLSIYLGLGLSDIFEIASWADRFLEYVLLARAESSDVAGALIFGTAKICIETLDFDIFPNFFQAPPRHVPRIENAVKDQENRLEFSYIR